MKIIKTYVCEYTGKSFDDLTELVEFLEDILNDKQYLLAKKLLDLSYYALIDVISEKNTLNIFEDIVKISKEIEQCKFVLETENSAPC